MGIIVRLDQMMSNRKIKLLELAEKIGITYANLSNLKNGKVTAIRFSTLENICKELNCQPGDILEYLDDEVLNLIDSISTNEIQREGALNRLYAYAKTHGQKNINIELAKECFNLTDNITIDKVVNVVTQYFKISKEDVKSDLRIKKIVNARQIILYLCRTETKETFKKICEYFNIDSIKLIFSCDKISEDLNTNEELKGDIQNIIKMLKE